MAWTETIERFYFIDTPTQTDHSLSTRTRIKQIRIDRIAGSKFQEELGFRMGMVHRTKKAMLWGKHIMVDLEFLKIHRLFLGKKKKKNFPPRTEKKKNKKRFGGGKKILIEKVELPVPSHLRLRFGGENLEQHFLINYRTENLMKST